MIYAHCYKNKFLPLPSGKRVDDFYKKALEYDTNGHAAFDFAALLNERGEHKRSVTMLMLAAKSNHHKAIKAVLLNCYEIDKTSYQHAIKLGLNANVKLSYLCNAVTTLSDFENSEDNDLNYKKAKSALIALEARQAEGGKFLIGYCIAKGLLGKKQDEAVGIELMVKNFPDLPMFLELETMLFQFINKSNRHIKLACTIAPYVIKNTEGLKRAEVKFDYAMLLLRMLQDVGKMCSPISLKTLIRESAEEGHFLAKQYIKSPDGKALLRDNSLVHRKPKTNNSKKKGRIKRKK